MLDASRLGEFLVVLSIYLIVVIITLFGLSRIKDRRARAITSGIVCFSLLVLPISFGVASALMATVFFGGSIIDSVRAIAFIIGEAGICTLYSYSLYFGKILFIAIGSILIVIAITATTYLFFS
jgi:hypothetical protein